MPDLAFLFKNRTGSALSDGMDDGTGPVHLHSLKLQQLAHNTSFNETKPNQPLQSITIDLQ